MKKLNPTWLTDELIDYEYNKYILLDYIQYIQEQIRKKKIYPYLTDLANHYDHIIQLKNEKMIMDNSFKKELVGFDLTEFNLKYKELISDNEYIDHIQKTINFAVPKLVKTIEQLTELEDKLKEELTITPVGIQASYISDGYMLLIKNKIYAYKYTTEYIEDGQLDYFDVRSYKRLNTTLVGTYSKDTPYQDIKSNITNKLDSYMHIAAYVIESPNRIPLKETYLPLAKDVILERISYDYQ